MKTMLLAAALSLGIGSAYAGDSEGASGNPDYVFPGTLYGGVMQNAPSAATAQKDQTVQAAAQDTGSPGLGTWLLRMFPLP
jgi:hypothetical protein